MIPVGVNRDRRFLPADHGAKSEFGPTRDLTWRVDRGPARTSVLGSLTSILSYPLHVRLPLISDIGRVKAKPART
jgi:hypothetical protein